MTNYAVELTPSVRNMGTEGGLDTSVYNGKSLQRTINVLEVLDENGNKKQISSLKDGESFNDEIANVDNESDE